MRNLLFIITAMTAMLSLGASMPAVDSGRCERHILSASGNGDFTVDVWLPEGYDDNDDAYPLLIMHDGQNLFDPELVFNHEAWEMDLNVSNLTDAGVIRPPVIAGVHCRSSRFADYSPDKAINADASLAADVKNFLDEKEPAGDKYLDFVANVLIPNLRSLYRLKSDRDNTAIMGSSMGGLISLYAICEYPEVFGAAGCLSTHLIGALDESLVPEYPEAFVRYLEKSLPDPQTHKIYLDHGTIGLDAFYPQWHDKVVDTMRRHGFDADSMMEYVDEGADHNEIFWRNRVERPLWFFYNTGTPLPPKSKQSVYLHFDDPTWAGRKFYAFVYSVGGSFNAVWPGAEMTPDNSLCINGISGGWLKYEVPEALQYSGLAMVSDNGSRRFPANNQSGIPLEGHSLAFIRQSGAWSVEKAEISSTVTDIAKDSVYPFVKAGDGSITSLCEEEISVYDISGRKIRTLHPGSTVNLSSGFYIAATESDAIKLRL